MIPVEQHRSRAVARFIIDARSRYADTQHISAAAACVHLVRQRAELREIIPAGGTALEACEPVTLEIIGARKQAVAKRHVEADKNAVRKVEFVDQAMAADAARVVDRRRDQPRVDERLNDLPHGDDGRAAFLGQLGNRHLFAFKQA